MLLRFCAICKRFARFYSETAAAAAAVKSFSDLSWQRVCIQSAKRRVATCHMPHAAAAQLTLEALLLLKAEEKEQAEVAAASRVGAAAAAAARLRGNL